MRNIPILTTAAVLVFVGFATLQSLSTAEPSAETTKSFTIAVLPDTQYYCDIRHQLSAKWGNGDLRRYFFEQTEWVRDNQERLNIAFLVHEGDIVQADVPEEWAIAKEAMSILDGKVRYCMCLGNHDMGYQKTDKNKYGFNIAVNRTTLFNQYFPREKFAKRREFGGTFDPDRHDNSWYHFETAGLKFLIVALEYHPRDEVLDWANRIVTEHPDHRAIVLTHSYLRGNNTRTTNRLKLKGNNGEQMWQKFVRKHKNVFMVLCGHFSGEAVLTSTGDHGNPVHQILSDYQEMNNGGESWLRYMVFKPESNKISIHTYNPALDKFRNGPSSRFDLDYPMTLLPKAIAANAPDKTNPVKALADRVRGYVNSQPLRFPNQHWVRGAYYAGLMAMYESTSDRAYLDDCMAWGKQVSWRIKEQGGGPYESGAYPLICGQIWYGCYRAENDEMMMRPTLAFLEDPKVENPVSAPGKWYLENTGHRFVDGLFTAPPVLAMLYQMTGDEKYVDWMDACFWDVHKEIFDHDAGLFYRDARSKPRKTKNGKKVLWSRGNGWAFGGLTRILKHLPEHHKSYARYKALYVQMAESLAKRQQADGFWRSNLDDPEQYAMKESSGTGFFCYGITWGINNGILNKERFIPIARKAWTALASVVNEDGKVGWSQPAGGGPGKVAEANTSKFGTGIFLLAASEMFLLTKSPAGTTKSKGKGVFFTGHSFFILGGYSAKKVDLIAKAAGKEKHELVGWRYSGSRSGAVDKWWEKGADQEPRKSVAAGKVDVLTVCTYWMKKGSKQERCVRNFVKLMQESNPDGLVYLITTKIPFDGKYKDKGGWNARTKAELAELSGWIDETHRYQYHYNGLVDELNKASGKTVIKAVPLYYGQALLRAQIIDGKVPGVKKQSELYSDAMGHVSELGQRLNAYTVFAAIYGESPVGLHVPEWEKSGDTVLRAQNLSLQKAAWAAVQIVPVTRNTKIIKDRDD